MKDILFIQSTLEIGGAETVLLNLLEASRELRERSLVVTLGYGSGDLVARLRALDADVVEFHAGRLRQPLNVALTVGKIIRLAHWRGVRWVIANGQHPQVFAAAVAKGAGARNAFLVNLIPSPRLLKNEPIDVVAYAAPSDLWLANSSACLHTLKLLRPTMRSALLYPGTPIRPVFEDQRRTTRQDLGVGDGEILYGIFGRLQRWKGQDIFVEAAARVRDQLPGARFLVVGGSVFGLEPEFDAALKSRTQALGLQDALQFTGFRSDVHVLMAACDVVCHTTRVPEPFGMVVIEAMAQARPVIATRGGGPSEIMVEGQHGLLTGAEDVNALVGSMVTLGENAELRTSLGAAALERVRQNFSSEAMARTLLDELSRAERG